VVRRRLLRDIIRGALTKPFTIEPRVPQTRATMRLLPMLLGRGGAGRGATGRDGEGRGGARRGAEGRGECSLQQTVFFYFAFYFVALALSPPVPFNVCLYSTRSDNTLVYYTVLVDPHWLFHLVSFFILFMRARSHKCGA
jgi:hypothetical protein